MRMFNFVVERDPDTGLYVGHVPGWPGAHSQGSDLDELQQNLQEVIKSPGSGSALERRAAEGNGPVHEIRVTFRWCSRVARDPGKPV